MSSSQPTPPEIKPAVLQTTPAPSEPVQDVSPPPVVSPADEVVDSSPRPSANAQPSFLYIDDDRLSREIMEMLVVKVLGYPHLTVFEENTGFMDRVRALPQVPDVVFLDIQMKPYTGYEMLKMLREDPVYRETKIIAMTASVMATDVAALRKAGFDGLIGKPIMRRIFPDLLKQILTGESVWFVA